LSGLADLPIATWWYFKNKRLKPLIIMGSLLQLDCWRLLKGGAGVPAITAMINQRQLSLSDVVAACCICFLVITSETMFICGVITLPERHRILAIIGDGLVAMVLATAIARRGLKHIEIALVPALAVFLIVSAVRCWPIGLVWIFWLSISDLCSADLRLVVTGSLEVASTFVYLWVLGTRFLDR
jgi:hypothetical protein